MSKKFFHIHHHENGPRLYLKGLRIHHGLTGMLVAVAGTVLNKPAITALGAVLVVDDAHDFPWSVLDHSEFSHR